MPRLSGLSFGNTKKTGDYDYTQKAAILLMSLESQSPGIAHNVFTHIGEERSRTLLKAITQLGKVDAPVINNITEEFFSLAIEQKVVFGGKSVSGKILKETFGIHQQDEYFIEKSTLFDFLEQVPDKDLLGFFKTENVQMTAVLLCHLDEDRMARIMAALDVSQSSVLSTAILKMNVPNFNLIWRLQNILQERLLGTKVDVDIEDTQQIFKLSRVLEMMGPSTRKKVMEILKKSDPTSVEKLQKLIFSFDNFEYIDDKNMQTILYEVESLRVLAIALSRESDLLKEKINQNISDRVRLMLDEEFDTLPDDLSEEDIIKAQTTIVQLARTLEKSKKIDPLASVQRQQVDLGDSLHMRDLSGISDAEFKDFQLEPEDEPNIKKK